MLYEVITLMFLLGLFFALLSFYLDNLRGMATASIGLYQVMGNLRSGLYSSLINRSFEKGGIKTSQESRYG